MDKIINGKNLDSILEYCLEIHETDNGFIFSHDLNSKLFPDLTLDEVELLFKYLNDFHLKVVDIEINGNPCLKINGLTEQFLKSGGFKKVFTDMIAESSLAHKKSELELKNLELQKDNFEYQQSIRGLESQILNLTRDNLRLENWDIRFRWYIAIGGFIIGFLTKYLATKI